MSEINSIKKYLNAYNQVLENTTSYREIWKNSLKETIKTKLSEILSQSEMKAKVEEYNEVTNLGAVILNLGVQKSGMGEYISDTTSKDFLKSNGSLVYQQLFNGKISIMINYPFIEGMSQPRQPHQIEILRPEELKEIFIYRHVEKFLKEVTEWEDFDDDDEPQTIGFNANYQVSQLAQEKED